MILNEQNNISCKILSTDLYRLQSSQQEPQTSWLGYRPPKTDLKALRKIDGALVLVYRHYRP